MYQFKVGDILVIEGEGVDYKVIDVSPEGCKVAFRSVDGADYTLLCKWGVYPFVLKQSKDKHYGTINFTKLEARLKHLSEGGKLLMRHNHHGDHLVEMNPQRNNIRSSVIKGGQIESIDTFLLKGYGDWFVYEKPLECKCVTCDGSGTIPISKALIPI